APVAAGRRHGAGRRAGPHRPRGDRHPRRPARGPGPGRARAPRRGGHRALAAGGRQPRDGAPRRRPRRGADRRRRPSRGRHCARRARALRRRAPPGARHRRPTEVLLLDPTASTPDGGFPARSFEGTPLALVGDTIVLRSCADGFCRLSGYDLTAPEEPSWVVSAPSETRGPDPAGAEVPARRDTPPGLLDALRTTGVMPVVPLSFDPAQGWVQLDPATGFPVGRILAGPEDECRIAATGAPA